MPRTPLAVLAIAVALAGAAWRPASAQESQSDVARLSVVEGEVSVTDGGSGAWGTGQVNAPLVGGDEIATGQHAKAELQLDSQNAVRLDGETQVRLATFTREQVGIELARGRLAYALGAAPVVPVQIASPRATFQPVQDGFYVVGVAPDGETRVTVRRGQGVIVKGAARRELVRGQTAVIAGADDADIRVEPAALPDAWERWAIEREDAVRGAQSWGKLNRNYVGAQDLDSHGAWREAPEYGRVWVPRAAGADWAPYREGYWVWKPYWGWVWVSNEPWGWAPYHYGRWVMIDGAWAWWPGPVTVTYVPVWAPAYVAFFDFDPRHHPRPGHVGWLPLGPADWCHPWWSRHNGKRPGGPGPARVEASLGATIGRVHDAPAIRPLVPPGGRHFSVLAGATRDARIRNAASELPAQQFGQRQRSSGRARLDDATFRNANLVVGGAPAMPARGDTPRVLRPAERPQAPQPAAVGVERAPGFQKPVSQPVLPSAVMPQKIPGAGDGASPRERFFVPPRQPNPAGARDAPKPFPAPGAPRLERRPDLAPSLSVTAPRPQAPPAQIVRPAEPARAPQIEPARPIPPIVRPAEPKRAPHIEPARPMPQIVRPPPPTHVQPMRPAQHAAPVRVERPSSPPAAAPRAAPPPRPASRSEPPRPAPQKNCGPKPCT